MCSTDVKSVGHNRYTENAASVNCAISSRCREASSAIGARYSVAGIPKSPTTSLLRDRCGSQFQDIFEGAVQGRNINGGAMSVASGSPRRAITWCGIVGSEGVALSAPGTDTTSEGMRRGRTSRLSSRCHTGFSQGGYALLCGGSIAVQMCASHDPNPCMGGAKRFKTGNS